MNKNTKIILITIICVSLLVILTLVAGFYYIYKTGTERGYLHDGVVSDISREEYLKEKNEIDQEEANLDLKENELERKYINREITYEEYRKEKLLIEQQEDELERKEDELERKYGIDD